MAVNNPNSLYMTNLPRWQTMNDVCAGAAAVKLAGLKYLPFNFDCDADQKQNNKRFDAYLRRAVFYPVTKDTLQNHVGLAFSEDPTFEPDGMDFLKSNADGAGTSIYQLNQKALNLLLKHGRGGFFVDYPQVEGGVSQGDVERGIRPTITLYDATQIINWRVEKFGGIFKTSLIVLQENTIEKDPQDEFSDIQVTTYRVLRLNENEEYSVQVWTNKTGELIAGEEIKPLINGRVGDVIPFIPIGAQSNDFGIDEIPLEGLADINLAHYRNSASYEKAVHICGEIQPVISELPEDWLEFLAKNKVKLGSDDALTLPIGAKFEYVSAKVEMVAKDAMTGKMDYMEALGAKVLDKTQTIKTATQVDSEDMTSHSVLSLCVSNLNEAAEYYLKWCAEYHGSGFDAKFVIKQDFARGEIGLEMLKFYQSEVVAGRMSKRTFDEIKVTGKVPEIAYEDELLRIEEERNGATI